MPADRRGEGPQPVRSPASAAPSAAGTEPNAALPAELRSSVQSGPEPLPPPRLQPRSPPAARPPPPAAFVVELPPAGDLSYFDAPRVVGWAIATSFSGCLWFAPSSAQSQPLNALADDSAPHRELYLENGALIGAFSTLPSDNLIDYLAPLWSRPQRQRAQAAVASLSIAEHGAALPREQLNLLCDANLLRRSMAMSHLANYMSELGGRALAAGPGRYRVLPRALTNNQRIETALPLRRMLVEGLRRGATLDFLVMRLGPAATVLRPTVVIGAREGGAALLDAGLTPAEEHALACFTGQLSLSQIADEAELGEHAVYVIAYALLCLGAVAVPRQSAKNIPRPQPVAVVAAPPSVSVAGPAPAPVPTPLAAPAAPQRAAVGDAEAAIRRVQQKFRQVEESDYFTLLELPASASTADVQQAHRALRAEFTPAALPYRCRSGLDRELRQIARALDEARAILGEDSARRVYLQKLGGAATSG